MSKMSEIIWLNTQANAAELQARLDAQPDGACINFAPQREYPGPLILNQAVVLEGGDAARDTRQAEQVDQFLGGFHPF